MKRLLFSSLLISAAAFHSQSHAISVVTTSDANVLANTIVGSGVTVNSATYTGAGVAAGTFTGGLASGLGIDSGIVLTSGRASFAAEANTFDDRTAFNGTGGNAVLSSISGGQTEDASVLAINFNLAVGGDIYFNYVFGSEEYNEFAGTSFNDVFGFFLDGSTAGDNVALIPGTSTPVSINTVNSGANAGFYRDNDAGTGTPSGTGNERPVNPALAPLPGLQYDGLTTVLTVQALGLAAGNHTILLAIADTADGILDSGVYIQAGTFSTTITPPPPGVTVPDGGSTAAFLGAGFAILACLRRRFQG